jgi:hypothetical protein
VDVDEVRGVLGEHVDEEVPRPEVEVAFRGDEDAGADRVLVDAIVEGRRPGEQPAVVECS